MSKIKLGITKKILIIFLAITISIVLTGFIATLFGANYLIRNTTIDYTYRLVSEVENSLYDYSSNMMSMAEAIENTPEIKTFIMGGKNKEVEEACHKVLKFSKETREDISNIFVMSVDRNGKLNIISNEGKENINIYADYTKTSWYNELINNNLDSILTSSYVQNLIQDQYNWVISLGKSIKDKNGEVKGIILIDLNYSYIERILKNVMPKEQGYIYLLSSNNELVYHPWQQLIFNKVKTEDIAIVEYMHNSHKQVGDKVYIALDSGISKWKTVAVLDSTVVYRNTLINTAIFIVIATFLILMSFYISYVFSNWFTKPIINMAKQMKKVEKGDLTVRVEVKSEDEIGNLAKSFNIMTEKLGSLVKRIVIEEEEKRNYELNALRAQINPHFLYNTLDSIIWMAECRQNEEVIEMTSALSKMLRASINNKKSGVTLGLEIQNIVNYLKIQKFRYSNRLNYVIDIPKELYEKKAAHLVLQPLVENAIYHGIKGKKGIGTITIKAYEMMEDKKILYIKVIDDGIGIKQEDIEKILDKKGKNPYGIGIVNVNKRIALIYGDEYGIEIKSEIGKGTEVTIRIPSIDAEEEGRALFDNQFK